MEPRIYKLSVVGHMRSVLTKAFTVTFLAAVFFTMTLGELMVALPLFNMVVIGSIIHEFATSVIFTVRMDGVAVKRGSASRELRFETFYFSSNKHGKLTVEDRRSSRTETIICSGFDKKLFADMLVQITRSQGEYFLRRNASGDFKSGARIKEADPDNSDASMKERAENAAAEASKRNPYSKNYAGKNASRAQSVSEPKQQIEIPVKQSEPAKTTAESTLSQTKTVPKSSDAAVIRSVLESFDKEINSDYKKMPDVVKVENTTYRELPKLEQSDAPRTIEKRSAPRESFAKYEFRYPRREITERCERANALTVLWGIFGAIAVFLVWYVLLGMNTGGTFVAACMILLVGTILTATVILVRSSRTRGIFSKLEIADDYLIIDNKRYRFSQMTEKHLTLPTQEVGIRRLSFTYDGKRIEYSLGHAGHSADKRDLYSFSRYTELCRLLKIKGFS